MSFKTFIRAWDDFWFKPISPLSIALYRIAYGILVLIYGTFLSLDLLTWFGNKGVLSVSTANTLVVVPRLNLLAIFPQNDFFVVLFFSIFMLAALSLTLGLFTRASAAIVFMSLATFHHRNPLIFNCSDNFLRLAAFYLIFSEAGSALSLDRLRRIANGKESRHLEPKAPWGQRLIQIQLAAIYLCTVIWKINGISWLNGTAVYYSSRIELFWHFPIPGIFEYLWLIKLVTWGTLILEFALGALVWFTEFRYPILILGLLFHLTLEYSMFMQLFQPIILTAYITFIEPNDLEHGLKACKKWLFNIFSAGELR